MHDPGIDLNLPVVLDDVQDKQCQRSLPGQGCHERKIREGIDPISQSRLVKFNTVAIRCFNSTADEITDSNQQQNPVNVSTGRRTSFLVEFSAERNDHPGGCKDPEQ